MQQGDEITRVKSLTEKFQNDPSLKIQTKPAIPQKSQTLTSPTTKVSNPLIATMNSALEKKRLRIAPRVIFSNKSPIRRQHSQPELLQVNKKDPHLQLDLLDKNQKKEGDLIKQALKDRKLPLVLPVSPVTQTVEVSPKSPSTPLSAPIKMSSPTYATFKMPLQSETNRTDASENALSASTSPFTPAVEETSTLQPTPSSPVGPAPIISKSLSPEACALPILVESVPPSSIPAPSIPAHAVPESDTPILAASEPDIFSNTDPKLELSTPQGPIILDSVVTVPDGLISPALTGEESSPILSDILDIVIPPPIIPEDLPDAVMPGPHIPASPSPFTDSTSPLHSCTASPAPATITPESPVTWVPPTLDLDTHDAVVQSAFSSASLVDPILENGVPESQNVLDQMQTSLEGNTSNSPKSISALSALARAEEMSLSKHNACDQRVLSVLERSKRKCATNQSSIPTTSIISMETAPPDNASPPEQAQTKTADHETPPPDEASSVPEAQDTPHIFPADYKGYALATATLEPESQSSGSTLNIDPSQASLGSYVLVEHSAAQVKTEPPPPPPRRHFPPVPDLDLTPDKPTQLLSTDEHSSSLEAPTVDDIGIIIPAPADFISGNSMPGDSKYTAETVTHEPPEEKFPEILHEKHAPSVQSKAYWVRTSPEDQDSEKFVPNVEAVDSVLTTETDGLPDLAPDSPGNETIPSLSGTQELNNNSGNHIYEDAHLIYEDGKQSKSKKQRKGSPMNPYAQAPPVAEETPKKTLFSRKNSGPNEKELKKKEKQREKEKEKDKVKEKKEQKEKDKEKKGPKEKELKEKEKNKKSQKEKEREKKELKEKEREKKEQKEKEKKENVIKKKFKVTGDEEVIYYAKVTKSSKGRKNDLAVKAGDTANIIRTTDCPKGKWLAKDGTNKYGYISVESVELDMQEMLKMGKKVKADSHANVNGLTYTEPTSTGSRQPNNDIMTHESFTDDSEEWGDDDDTFVPTDTTDLQLNQSAISSESVSPGPLPAQHEQQDTSGNVQARQEALQKLATFFAQPMSSALRNSTITEEADPEEPVSSTNQDVDLHLLPPPDLYADHEGAAWN